MHIERNPGLSLDASGRPQPMVSAVGGNPFPQQDDYAWVYFHLIEEKGEERAADIVSELILSKGGPRVLEIVKLEAANEDLFIRADDPELVIYGTFLYWSRRKRRYLQEDRRIMAWCLGTQLLGREFDGSLAPAPRRCARRTRPAPPRDSDIPPPVGCRPHPSLLPFRSRRPR